MTNKKKNTPAQRLGAAALATATVVSGLAFGPGAVAAPSAERGTTVTSATSENAEAESTRRVGPLVINSSDDVQYGLRIDPDTMRTTTVDDASWFSLPAVGQQGQVRGTGANDDRCLIPTYNFTYLAFATCSDSSEQLWTWTDANSVQGFDKTLAPVARSNNGLVPRGAGTFLFLLSGGGKRPLVMDERMLPERELTAVADGEKGSVSGVATTGATVSARGESVEVGEDGSYELSFAGLPEGTHSIEVTQTLPNGAVSGTATVDLVIDSVRLVGPLAMAVSETDAFGVRLDPDAMRPVEGGTVAEAQANASFWSVPKVGRTGLVRGVGDDSDSCLTWVSAASSHVGISGCDGSETQQWQWVEVPAKQGAEKGLAPVGEDARAIRSRGEGTYVQLSGLSTAHPFVLDEAMRAERGLTAKVVVDDLARSATITGAATTGSTVSARGVEVETAEDGTYSLPLSDLPIGTTTVEITQTLFNGDVLDSVDVDVEVAASTGPLASVEMAPVEITRGADTEVTFETKVAADALRLPVAEVTVTAPEGTTFTEGQDEIAGAFVRDGQEDPTGMQLTGGMRSDDGRTYSYTWDTAANGATGWQSPKDEVLRWKIAVTTSADAADVDGNAMDYSFVGTSDQGAFRAMGSAPVSVVGDFGSMAPVAMAPVELTRGADTEVTFETKVAADALRLPVADVTLTAPEGTVFAAGQDEIVGVWIRNGREDSAGMKMTGERSEDGRTYTYTWDTAANGVPQWQSPRDEVLRWKIAVTTPADAADVDDNAMGYTFVGTSVQGGFRATGSAPVTFVSSYAGVTLDNLADGDTFTPGDVTFSGTGQPGATVTVAPSTGAGVSTEVRADGTWSAVRYLGNASYTMSVKQVAATGENTIEKIRLFSNAVVEQDFSVTTPAAGAGHTQQGWVTFTGVGTTWSTVSISDGSDSAATKATVQYDGTWSARRWVGTEKTTFTVTSSRADVQNGSQTIEFNTGVSGQAFSLDSHTDGGTFTPGNIVFRGKGSTGDKVTFTAPGLAPLEATVNAAGEWSIPRWLGNGYITFTVTHTPVTGDETKQTLRLFSDQVAQGDLIVTAPIDGASHDQPGWVTFTGTGTTWSKVTVSDDTSAAPSTATVQVDGSWTVRRWVGTTATTFTVSSERGGIANGSQTLEFNVGETADGFTIGSHTDGGTFTPGNVAITGTGTTGDKVTITAPGLAPLETEVDSRGRWSIQRWLGNGFITFTVTHTPVTGDETKQTLRLFSDQVAQGDLVVTAPLDGASHDAAGWVTFTGTGTTWSKVSISDGTSAAPSVATVQYDGSWTVRRWVGTAPVTFTVTSERADIENGSQTIRFNTAE
ncbi:hypothetical protein [Frigoribacterium sp. CFBP9030]|uniref:hypothetical protein n=1 Tax=Frigoribacterium sp. CFBP9030 TaxID=3096537 RepID=UPI002A6B73CF|nr:hypothetical protein [Frigoribacterium sp. CFBP9030]MDY0892648.1 hypothetical protein [Frigoribacterium sp. CFBP9030]